MAHEIKIYRTQNSRLSQFDPHDIGFGKIFTDHMFVADYDGQQWTDLRIEPYGGMALSPATSALHYGQAIFEGMKAFAAGEDVLLFRPLDNWKRLNISAERMVMPAIPQEIFMQALSTLVDLERQWVPNTEGSSLYIRPFMFATDDYVGVKPSEKYRFVIFCCPVGPYYSKPLRVKVEEDYSRSAPGGTGFAKCAGNYGGSMYATKKAQDEGYDQVLWTDPKAHEFVEETGTTNFFAVLEDTIVTPDLSENLLAGITRDSAIQILKSMGKKVEERPLSVTELKSLFEQKKIKELFITGTAATLINLVGFGHHGKFYDVMENGDTTLSEALKKQLDDMRYGHAPDSFGWLVKVDQQVSEMA
jgi:branched-chain amino acid aminotransferase